MLSIFKSPKFSNLVKSELIATQSGVLMMLRKRPFEKDVIEGENDARNQHFLLFPLCFPPFYKTNLTISGTSTFLSANALD